MTRSIVTSHTEAGLHKGMRECSALNLINMVRQGISKTTGVPGNLTFDPPGGFPGFRHIAQKFHPALPVFAFRPTGASSLLCTAGSLADPTRAFSGSLDVLFGSEVEADLDCQCSTKCLSNQRGEGHWRSRAMTISL